MVKTEIIYDNTDITANSKQIEILKKHFPSCFDKNGDFVPHKMAEMVGKSELELSKESYSLNWLGKSYARLLANENPLTLLAEDKEHNSKEENKNSQNILIKGDNLEVLKHLKNAYAEKIKMIYIDPPYNTGSDGFVYEDDRKFTIEELSKLAGIGLEEAKRILDFTKSKANSHSAWLTFMYPRLYVARELLKEDGVIFISIDDNEAAQLKMLCDEVFGEENFVAQLIWKKKKGGGNDSKYIAVEHEYIVMYAKGKNKLSDIYQSYTGDYIKRYNEEDNDGKYYWDTFKRKSGKQYYPIIAPDQTVLEFDENGNRISWLRSEARFKEDIQNGEIKFERSKDNGWTVFFKQRLPQGKTPRSLLLDIGTTSEGSAELLDMFKAELFQNPKTTNLLNFLLQIGINKDDLVLDFFAGSGTTAHAVMELNASDDGNRKFIAVQIPEETDAKSEAHKAGYKTIFDITKARIEKAATKIKKEKPEFTGDLGFKIFESVHMFDGYLDNIEELREGQEIFDGSLLDTTDLEHLLTTWKVYDGMELIVELSTVMLGEYEAYYHDKILYFANKGFNTEALKAFAAKLDDDGSFGPSKLVVFGYNFDSKSQRELKEALTNYKNKKAIELDITVRY